MKISLKPIGVILKRSFLKYRKDDPIKMAGTTAYFTIFAIAPILIIIISVFGLVLQEERISGKIFEELEVLIGGEGTDFVRNLVTNFQSRERNIAGTIIGFAIFIFTSTTFFSVLQNSLNYIWRVRAKPKNNLLRSLIDRLLSFGLILSIGFILVVSLVIDASLSFFRDFLERYINDYTLFIIKPMNLVISFVVITVVFALIYRYLPDTKVKWKVVWVGALSTALLFFGGKYLIGWVLASTNLNAMYGAAGSVVIIVLWVFYSSIIFFFGAEITHQYAEYYNYRIAPKDYAIRIKIMDVEEQE